jgi:hypothetical protein
MLEFARARPKVASAFSFSQQPMQQLRLDAEQSREGFDLAVALYTAIGYLTVPADVDSCLRRLHAALKPGACFFGDLWNGHRMARDFQPNRERHFENAQWQGTRHSKVIHVPARNALMTHFTCTIVDRHNGHRRQFEEDHLLRYYTPIEWETLLLAHGFSLMETAPLFEPSETLETCWNFYFLAKRNP